MCLNNIKKITVDEDIVCYKVVNSYKEPSPHGFIRFRYIADVYYSKYLRFIYKLNEEYTSDIGIHNDYIFDIDTNRYMLAQIINEGFHSYKHLDDAKIAAKDFVLRNTSIILKCIIPKGSTCYEGTFTESINEKYHKFESFASDKIKIIEEV